MKTPEEIGKLMHEFMKTRLELHEKIVAATRPVIPVLLDSGRANSARPLQELFFELDAKEQEIHNLVTENIAATLEALKAKLGR